MKGIDLCNALRLVWLSNSRMILIESYSKESACIIEIPRTIVFPHE